MVAGGQFDCVSILNFSLLFFLEIVSNTWFVHRVSKALGSIVLVSSSLAICTSHVFLGNH